MKKQFLLFGLLFIALFSACKKERYDATTQASIDDAKIKAYIVANHINATRASSGIYYEIVDDGTGAMPNDTSHVQVNYEGKLLNGTVFSPQQVSTIALADAVVGWQDGLPLMHTGGRMTLIVPSALGYGTEGSDGVPANAVLVFTIDLLGYF